MAFRTTFAALGLLAVSMPAWAGSYTQTNLVSDGAVAAAVTDPHLKNPWGISYTPTGPFWVSDNNAGLTTLYNGSGAIQGLVVSVPAAAGSTAAGSPTGQVFNPGSAFVVSEGSKSAAAAFLFATEDGTISGWNFGVDAAKAIVAVDRSKVGAGAVYKGITLYTSGAGKTYLLATDFRNGKVDVFDGTFNRLWSFRDRYLPADYAPYNIAAINHKIYVTYAKQDATKHDSISGKGYGAVEEVGLKGKVFAKSVHGDLNAPWGLAVAPAGFGRFGNHVLVGNFGDGHITGFSANLTPVGQLMGASGYPIAIDGLWGLIVGNGGSAGSASALYFSAGPNAEADGLFGSLSYAP